MNYDSCIVEWNIDTLRTLVWECMIMPHYEALFVTDNFMTKSLVKDWCRMMLTRKAEIKSDTITFSNGSSIKFIRTKSTARGYRVNKILIDDVDINIVNTILKPFLRDYVEESRTQI